MNRKILWILNIRLLKTKRGAGEERIQIDLISPLLYSSVFLSMPEQGQSLIEKKLGRIEQGNLGLEDWADCSSLSWASASLSADSEEVGMSEEFVSAHFPFTVLTAIHVCQLAGNVMSFNPWGPALLHCNSELPNSRGLLIWDRGFLLSDSSNLYWAWMKFNPWWEFSSESGCWQAWCNRKSSGPGVLEPWFQG